MEFATVVGVEKRSNAMAAQEMYNRVKLIAIEEFGTLQGVDIKLTQNPESGVVTYCVTLKAA